MWGGLVIISSLLFFFKGKRGKFKMRAVQGEVVYTVHLYIRFQD